jgi:hypothetical protein
VLVDHREILLARSERTTMAADAASPASSGAVAELLPGRDVWDDGRRRLTGGGRGRAADSEAERTGDQHERDEQCSCEDERVRARAAEYGGRPVQRALIISGGRLAGILELDALEDGARSLEAAYLELTGALS